MSDPNVDARGGGVSSSVHRREVREAVREERRLFRAEVWCLLVIAGIVLARQLWLV